MGLKDIFNKGLEYAQNGVNTVVTKAKEKKEAMDNYNLLITTSKHIENMLPYEVKNSDPSIGREQRILELCLTVTVDKAKVINSLIPVEETVIDVKMTTESKTQMSYYAVITDKGLWVLNNKEYRFYAFNTYANFEIINKSIMSQGVKFDNNAFSFEGTTEAITKFANILTDENARKNAILDATSYLCGVIPKLQLTYMNFAGITIGINNELVLHRDKAINKKIALEEVGYMQMLADNTVIMTRGKEVQANISAQTPCRKLSLKFIMKNGETFEFDIMPQNIMGTLVKVEDSAYQRSFAFGKKIMETVISLTK